MAQKKPIVLDASLLAGHRLDRGLRFLVPDRFDVQSVDQMGGVRMAQAHLERRRVQAHLCAVDRGGACADGSRSSLR